MTWIQTIRRLLTYADLDNRDPDGGSVSARHVAVLSDGREVLLLDDRGWSSSQPVDQRTVEEVERTTKMVVGPDEPAPGQTRAAAEAAHWATLEGKLKSAGVTTDRVDLGALPHEVVLSKRLRGSLKE